MFPTLSQSTSDSAARPAPSQREPVLLVEDDKDAARECAFTLRALGYDPLIAQNVEEALALFRSRPVSVAIIEEGIASRDQRSLSFELARTAQAQGRKLHFIMMTGTAAKEAALDDLLASSAEFLEKPVRPADLRSALHRIDRLDQAPVARQAVLNSLANMRAELQRLAQLVDNPDVDTQLTPDQPSPVAGETPAGDDSEPADQSRFTPPALANHIRDLLKEEARRRSIGGGEVFGDPAWEMLLDLMLAKIEGRHVSVSSACIASGAPMSTALRLVGRLVAEGVLGKFPDRTDRRRHFLVINPRFEQPLLEYLSEQLRRPRLYS